MCAGVRGALRIVEALRTHLCVGGPGPCSLVDPDHQENRNTRCDSTSSVRAISSGVSCEAREALRDPAMRSAVSVIPTDGPAATSRHRQIHRDRETSLPQGWGMGPATSLVTGRVSKGNREETRVGQPDRFERRRAIRSSRTVRCFRKLISSCWRSRRKAAMRARKARTAGRSSRITTRPMARRQQASKIVSNVRPPADVAASMLMAINNARIAAASARSGISAPSITRRFQPVADLVNAAVRRRVLRAEAGRFTRRGPGLLREAASSLASVWIRATGSPGSDPSSRGRLPSGAPQSLGMLACSPRWLTATGPLGRVRMSHPAVPVFVRALLCDAPATQLAAVAVIRSLCPEPLESPSEPEVRYS